MAAAPTMKHEPTDDRVSFREGAKGQPVQKHGLSVHAPGIKTINEDEELTQDFDFAPNKSAVRAVKKQP